MNFRQTLSMDDAYLSQEPKMSMSFFYRHRNKFAAFFYFVGFIQIIYYTTGKLIPNLNAVVSFPYLLSNPSVVFSFLWDAVLGIGFGLLFLAVAWLMTSIPSPSTTSQSRIEPKAESQTQQ